MEQSRRLFLVGAILSLPTPLLWVLSELTLEGGSQYITVTGAVFSAVLGVFLLALYRSSRTRAVWKSVTETAVVQATVLLFGIGLLLFAGVTLYDLVTAYGSESVEYYVGGAFWLVICGSAGSSFVYVTAREFRA